MTPMGARADVTVHLDLECASNDAPCDAVALTYVATDALRSSGRCGRAVRDVTISVASVDPERMRAENRRLRAIDAPTDVLSCGHYSDMADLRTAEIAHIFLGEVILCYTQIVLYAQEDGTDPLTEFYTAFAHGVLHLTGLHHGAQMFRVQDDVVARFMQHK